MNVRSLLAVTAACAAAVCSGCGPRVTAGRVAVQSGGGATFIPGRGDSTVATTGSATRLGTFPIGKAVPTTPHQTFVVFRDKERRTDTVVRIDAVGNYVESSADGLSVKESFAPGDNLKVVTVAGRQFDVRVEPRDDVDLARVTPCPDAPVIRVTAGRKINVVRGFFSFDDAARLDEIASVTFTRPAVGGDASLTFVKADGNSFEVAGPTGPSWESAFEDLKRTLNAVAPHVDCRTGRSYWRIVVGVLIVLFVLGAIINGSKS